MALFNPLRQRWRRWFSRRFPATSGPVTVSAQRVYILPTAGGWAFLAMLVALWLFAINYSNNLIYILLFWLAGLGLLALVHTHRQLVGLSMEVLPKPPQFENEPLQVKVRVINFGNKVARGLMLGPAWAVQSGKVNREGLANSYASGNSPKYNGLKDADSSVEKTIATVYDVAKSASLDWAPEPPGRGLFVVPMLRLSTVYPFGLYRAWTFLHQPVEVLLYPLPQAEARLPAIELARDESNSGVSRALGSDEFDGLRRYQKGDAPRHIAWRVAAKRGGLLALSLQAQTQAQAQAQAQAKESLAAREAGLTQAEGNLRAQGSTVSTSPVELQTLRFSATGEQQLQLTMQAARAAVALVGSDAAGELLPVDELALRLLCRQVLMAREQGLSFQLETQDQAAAEAASTYPDAALAELALFGKTAVVSPRNTSPQNTAAPGAAEPLK